MTESIKAKIDEIAHGYLRDGRNVGLAIAIVSGDEEQIFCYGTTDKSSGVPIGPDSVFEIGSITKVFTGILLAEAIRRDEVKPDDPVNRFLPENARIPVKGRKPLTVWHLTTHTGGIPRVPDNIDRDVFLGENPYSTYSVEQMYEYLHRTPVTPGRQHAYSNLGVGLLGHILSLAAGKGYETLVRERVLDSLELDDTSITLSDDQRSRLALPHDGGRQVSLWDIPTLSGAGALRSTITDMLEFLKANVQPTSSLLTESIERTHKIETRGNPFQQNLGCWFAMGLFYALVEIGGRLRIGLYGWPALIPGFILVFGLPIYVALKWPKGFATMGFGWFMDRLRGTPHLMTWHNGGTGGDCSFIGFTRESGCGVVVLSNSTNSVDSIGARILTTLNTIESGSSPGTDSIHR